MTDVTAITEREITLVSRFISLLQDEQETLKRADATALAEIGAAKIDLVEQLNSLETERRDLLGITGNENTRQAMTDWLANHPQAQTAAVNWESLLNLAREAKQLHELNASIVGMHLRQTSEALFILTRQAEQHALYGSDGQASQISGSRIVDSA